MALIPSFCFFHGGLKVPGSIRSLGWPLISSLRYKSGKSARSFHTPPWMPGTFAFMHFGRQRKKPHGRGGASNIREKSYRGVPYFDCILQLEQLDTICRPAAFHKCNKFDFVRLWILSIISNLHKDTDKNRPAMEPIGPTRRLISLHLYHYKGDDKPSLHGQSHT